MPKEKSKASLNRTNALAKPRRQKSIKMLKNAAAEYKTENNGVDKFINKIICGDTIEVMKSKHPRMHSGMFGNLSKK